jgi:hypothetical protein
MANRIRIKRGTSTNKPTTGLSGEPIYTTDDNQLYIYNGTQYMPIGKSGNYKAAADGDVNKYSTVLAWASSVEGAGAITINGSSTMASATDAAWTDVTELTYVVFTNNDARRVVLAIPDFMDGVPYFAQRLIYNGGWYNDWNYVPKNGLYLLKAGDTLSGSLFSVTNTGAQFILQNSNATEAIAFTMADDGSLQIVNEQTLSGAWGSAFSVKSYRTGDPNAYVGFQDTASTNFNWYRLLTTRDTEVGTWVPSGDIGDNNIDCYYAKNDRTCYITGLIIPNKTNGTISGLPFTSTSSLYIPMVGESSGGGGGTGAVLSHINSSSLTYELYGTVSGYWAFNGWYQV